MKLIKNLAVFGAGFGIGVIGVCTILGVGLLDGDKLYEDDEVYVKSIHGYTKYGYRMAMVYDKNTYEGTY